MYWPLILRGGFGITFFFHYYTFADFKGKYIGERAAFTEMIRSIRWIIVIAIITTLSLVLVQGTYRSEI